MRIEYAAADNPSVGGTNRSSTAQRTAKPDIDELQKKISSRLGSLEPEERTSQHAARIFVESALAWEFGAEILTDPSEVQNALTDSGEARARLHELLKKL
jgi:hypothetical protein